MKEQEPLFDTFAEYYDKVYSDKNYKEEVKLLKQLIKKYKQSEGKDLLDFACGTGNHLQYLTDEYNCTGSDISKEMIVLAQKKVPSARFVQSDMAELDLQMKFDILICLFSSIGYILSLEKLEKTYKTIYQHTKKGGVLFIEPWLEERVYKAGSVHMSTYEDELLKIARVNLSEKKGKISLFDLHYLIAEHGKPVKHIVEHHELALFEHKQHLALLRKVGFRVEHLKKGITERGLFIAVKD